MGDRPPEGMDARIQIVDDDSGYALGQQQVDGHAGAAGKRLDISAVNLVHLEEVTDEPRNLAFPTRIAQWCA